MFRWAIRAGYVDENPVRRVERFSEKGRARETYLTADECAALLDACSPVLRPLVLAALHTGARRGELLGLRWRDVDLERGEVLIAPESDKAGRGRTIPTTPALLAELGRLKAERPRPRLDASDAVFTLHDGGPLRHETLRVLMREAVDRCEAIPLAKRAGVTMHALRHTAASLMVGAGVPLFDVAKILGHSTLSVTMRYAHFAPEAGRASVEALGNALAEGTKGGARKAGTGG